MIFKNWKRAIRTFAEAEAEKKPTFSLWLSYIQMVQVLLMFLRGTRENDWNLHIFAVRSMLPWFFVTDRVHYARYGTIYWLEMLCLETSHPGKVHTFHGVLFHFIFYKWQNLIIGIGFTVITILN